MSGKEESEWDSGIEQMKKLDKMLDEYQDKLEINFEGEYEINEYLNLKKVQIEQLTPIQCGEIAAYLSNYLIYLQQQLNREIAKMNWAEANVKLIIGKYISQYQAFGFEEKKIQCIRENEAAFKLEKVRVAAKSRVDNLSYIPNRIEFFVKTLMNLQNSKSYKS